MIGINDFISDKQLVEKLQKASEEVSKKGIKAEADHIIKKKHPKPNLTSKPKAEKKPRKKSGGPKFSQEKIDLINNIIQEMGLSEFGHNDVLSVVQERGGLGLKLDSNWKESWAIMQEMVRLGMLEKNGRKYKISSEA